ncbi:hypothetical protein TorRG33x02_220220 [Trema orientale]|uniref:Uncharacterized protein n=1 Tax=Trema orientale TaxID=63057 RepID=A0A2P5E9H4_TREOI|nr:hypothetical protein TorRG33x02_220220 [Trema orientale]
MSNCMIGHWSTCYEPWLVQTRQGMKIRAATVVVVWLGWVQIVLDDSSGPWALIPNMRCSF